MKAAPQSETNSPKRLTGNQRTGGCKPICGRVGEIEPDWQPLR